MCVYRGDSDPSLIGFGKQVDDGVGDEDNARSSHGPSSLGNDLAVGNTEGNKGDAVSGGISVLEGDTRENRCTSSKGEEVGRRNWQAPRQRREKLSVGGDAVMLWGEEGKKGNGDVADDSYLVTWPGWQMVCRKKKLWAICFGRLNKTGRQCFLAPPLCCLGSSWA